MSVRHFFAVTDLGSSGGRDGAVIAVAALLNGEGGTDGSLVSGEPCPCEKWL